MSTVEQRPRPEATCAEHDGLEQADVDGAGVERAAPALRRTLGRLLAFPALAGLGLGLAYAALAELITIVGHFGNSPGSPASFWPAAGITVVALVLSPRRAWPWLLGGVCIAEAAVDVFQVGVSLSVAVGWALANAVEPSLSALLVLRFVGSRPDLTRRRHLLRFVVCAVLAGPALGAAVGGLTSWLFADVPLAFAAARWFVGDSVGVLVVAPVLLARVDRRGTRRVHPRLGLAIIGAAAFATFAPFFHSVPAPYLILPAVVWLALQEGERAAAEVVLVVAVVVNAATVLNLGPFAASSAVDGLLVAQMFLGTTAFSALTVASLASDLVGRDEVAAKLRLQATHDVLTGLPNRILLLERLAEIERSGPGAALAFVDLDDFKDVNDSYGHDAGDALLTMVAARLAECTRPDDLLVRLGGDEFALLLVGERAGAAPALVERLVATMGAAFPLAGDTIHVSASVGLAASSDLIPPAELLRSADVAMYEAKLTCKGSFRTFDPAQSAAAALRASTGRELHVALERGQFVLHYQPIVSVASGRMAGAEALVRWQHPQRGLLAPGDFIPAAERTGLVVPLGAWVLAEACRQGAAWQAARPGQPPLLISVNLSAQELSSGTVVKNVEAALAQTGLAPSALCLEVTETGMLASPGEARKTIGRLQALGVSVAIDDFGTGYGSLSYLQRLEVDVVKIDKSFIDGLGSEPDDTTIVAAVIGLAHAMGLLVIAEGVETADQLLVLRDMGCQQAQGFYLARPVPAGELAFRLDDNWIAGAVPAESATPHGEFGPDVRVVPAAPVRDRYRILLADDDADDRLLQRRALEATDRFEVVGEAGDGEMAVRMAALLQPHLVVLDQKMPRADGLTALPWILLAAPNTQVVLVSGYASPHSVERALAAGAAAFHRKGVPDLAAELLRLVESPSDQPTPPPTAAPKVVPTSTRARGGPS